VPALELLISSFYKSRAPMAPVYFEQGFEAIVTRRGRAFSGAAAARVVGGVGRRM
jgi:hypothetical protein